MSDQKSLGYLMAPRIHRNRFGCELNAMSGIWSIARRGLKRQTSSGVLELRNAAVRLTATCRLPVPARDPPFTRDHEREVDASPCEQSRGHQSLAGMLVVEKNRCTRIGVSSARARRSAAVFRAGRDSIRDSYGDNLSPRKLRGRLYLVFSRGEVAERLKAAVC